MDINLLNNAISVITFSLKESHQLFVTATVQNAN
jgi:hypothetical protein